MAQNHLKFNNYQPPDVDEDGYSISFAVTSTSGSGRTMRGIMKNVTLFTAEAYTLKWSNIKVSDASNILSEIMGKDGFSFFHFNVYTAQWETSQFYVANINSPVCSLVDGKEMVKELSFQVTGVNPV